jgi:hypothetical protein
MSKAKNSNSVEKDEQWLVRMPGGPLRLLRSNRSLSEDMVKEIYVDQLRHRRSRSLDDPDTKWPFLKLTTDDEVKKDHAWLLQESRRKNYRGVIDVVDGKVISDRKDLPVQKRVATRVETTTR